MAEAENENVQKEFFGMDVKILRGIGYSLFFVVGGLAVLNVVQYIRNKNIKPIYKGNINNRPVHALFLVRFI